MPVLRTIKNQYSYYHHQQQDVLIAVDEQNNRLIRNYQKQSRKPAKAKLPNKIQGYKFVVDEELETLKIDFSKVHTFNIQDLVSTK